MKPQDEPVNASPQPTVKPLDVTAIRAQFPILDSVAHGKPLVYLDNSATTQKPRAVIDRLVQYYESTNANIHRGVYELSEEATRAYDQARHAIQRFINAKHSQEIIFTRGATESINLVAAAWGRGNLRSGDEVIVSAMEHHSNIVPWQMICHNMGAKLKVIPMNDNGELQLDQYLKLLNERTKMVAITHLSNALGTINDIAAIIQFAHQAGAKTLIDGAQWVAHYPTDVQSLDADFYAFSGHKLFGPTGIGVLYGKRDLLDRMPPYQGGGDMIASVTFEKTIYADLPSKYEAGTPHIAGAIGLGAAVEWLSQFDFKQLIEHEEHLLRYATDRLTRIPGLRIIGTARRKGSVISFVMENPVIAALDVGTRLDGEGIAVRTGHHCCQPVMDRLNIPATTRASFTLYNTTDDIDRLVEGMNKVVEDARGRGRSIAHPQPSATSSVQPSVPAEPQYPGPFAESPDAAAAELIEAFEFLDDWEARHQYIMEMGEKIPAFPDSERTGPNRVHGCQSTVFLSARLRPDTVDVLDFIADSDAHLVRGLIALLERVYAGQRAGQILRFDVDAFFRKVGLDQHLSMGRRNGLSAMVGRIRGLATKIDETAGLRQSGKKADQQPLYANPMNIEPPPEQPATTPPPPPPAAPKPPTPKPPSPALAGGHVSNSIERKLLEGKVIEAMRTVFDPEIPVNIYDLGLIYEIDVREDNSVFVKMTLTAPACPVAGTLPGEVQKCIEVLREVKSAEVELVWDPPWSRDRMSETALLELGLV